MPNGDKVGSPVAECPKATLLVRVERYPAAHEAEETWENKVTVKRLQAPEKDKLWGAKAKCEDEAEIAGLEPGRYLLSCEPPKAKWFEFDASVPVEVELVRSLQPHKKTLRISIPKVPVLRLKLFRGLSPRTGRVTVEFRDAGNELVHEEREVALDGGLLAVELRKDLAAKAKFANVYFLKKDGTKSRTDALRCAVGNAAPDFAKADHASKALVALGAAAGVPLADGHTLDKPRKDGDPPAQWETDLAWARLLRERGEAPVPFDDAAQARLEKAYYAYEPGFFRLPGFAGDEASLEHVPVMRVRLFRGNAPRKGSCDVLVVAKDGTYICQTPKQLVDGVLEITVPRARLKEADSARVYFAGKGRDALLLRIEDPASLSADAQLSRVLRNLGERTNDPAEAKATFEGAAAWEQQSGLARLWRGLGHDAGRAAGEALAAYHGYDWKTPRLPGYVASEIDLDPVELVRLRLVRGTQERTDRFEAVVEAKDGTYLCETGALEADGGLLAIPVPKARVKDVARVRVYVVRNGRRVDGFVAHLEDAASLSPAAKTSRLLHNLGFTTGVSPADEKLADAQKSWAQAMAAATALRAFGLDVPATLADADANLEAKYLETRAIRATLPTIDAEPASLALTTLVRLKLFRGGRAVAGSYAAEVISSDGTIVHESPRLDVRDGELEIPVPQARAKNAAYARVYRLNKDSKRIEGLLVRLEDPAALTPDAAASRQLHNLGLRGGPVFEPKAKATDAQVAWQLNAELALAQREAGLPVTAFSPDAAQALAAGYLDWTPGKSSLESLDL